MTNFYSQLFSSKATRQWATAGLFLGTWLLATTVKAQAPAWVLATTPSTRTVSAGLYNENYVNAVATDANGNVFVTGLFNGAVAFGSTTLTSAGNTDIFVAKYVPATNAWAWAVRAGGTGVDEGLGIAISGNSVYLTGYINNSTSNSSAVTLQSTSAPGNTITQLGASGSTGYDILVAKYTDNGPSATLAWSQVAGGTDDDRGQGIAVSGSSVYVTGSLSNSRTNDSSVLFGGSGTTLGTVSQLGASASGNSADIFLAKYTDNGSNATPTWTHVGGGTSGESGSSVAVSGSSVYLTGTITNTSSNASSVVFGGTGSVAGTVPQLGATSTSSTDLVLAKYTDNGTTGTFGWSQVGGGTDYDFGFSVAASGNNVYMTGYLLNNTSNAKGVLFGGSGLAVGTTTQLGASSATVTNFILAKYVDNGTSGTLGWTQVGGGTGSANSGHSVLASGNMVYVTGNATNNRFNGSNVVFGGTGTTLGTFTLVGTNQSTSTDLLVIKYTDNGPTATINWAQLGGGGGYNVGLGLAASSTRLYVAGKITAPGTFGSLSTSAGSGSNEGFLGALDLAGTTTATLAATSTSPRLYPNPAAGPATLSGAPVRAAVQVVDALGRHVATATTDANGTAQLPAELPPGLYLVRAGIATVRWVVE